MADRVAPVSDDEHLIERHQASTTLLSGGFLRVRRDTVVLPDGKLATREFVVHPGAVVVVPLLDDGHLLLERQFRYPVAQVLTEFPAGKIDAGERILDCAIRELREETGYTAAEWALGGTMHNAAAYSTEIIHLVFARGLKPGPAQLDTGEFLELLTMREDELEALAAQGALTDVKTLVGLLWLGQWRKGLRQLDWQPVAMIAP